MFIRYLSGILALLLAYGIVLYGLFYLQLGAETEGSRWIKTHLQRKEAVAAAQAGPRLLVVGGSSAFFGVRAGMLQRSLGMPAANLAVHAGLGLRYILDRTRKIARPGDTLLLGFEYAMYQSADFDQVAIDYIAARDPDYFRKLSAEERLTFIAATPLSRVGLGLLGMMRAPAPGRKLYDSLEADDHGDLINNYPDEVTATKIAGLKPLSYHTSEESLALLREFSAWASCMGIRVIVVYPPFLGFPDYAEGALGHFFAELERFWKEQPVVALGMPGDFLYPGSLMYDSHYHLNVAGAEIHTERLIQGMRQIISVAADSSLRSTGCRR